MGYERTGLTASDLGNVPDENPLVECAEPRCDATRRAQQLPGDWQATAHPEEVVLCPRCKARTPDARSTPSEVREKSNKKPEWSE